MLCDLIAASCCPAFFFFVSVIISNIIGKNKLDENNLRQRGDTGCVAS